MRVLILSSLRGKTGNNSTARRIRQELLETDIKCELAGVSQFDGTESINRYIIDNDIDCIIGVHAYRAGSLLFDCKIPYCIILGGTDINEYYHNEDYMETMTKAVTNARYLVAFSEAMKNQALQLWPNCQSKITIQPQAFDMKKMIDDETQILKCQNMISDVLHLDIKSVQDTLFFLLVAGLRRVKDPLFLADAVSDWHRQDSRIYLIIIGPELDKEFASEIKSRIQDLPGVVLMAPLANDDLQTVMRLSCGVVNSSISEGMSTSLVESMALGIPVLARNISANAAIINNGYTGFLFNKPEDFVLLGKELIQSKSLWYSIIKNAQAYVQNTHSYENEKATYVSILEKMILSK